MKHGKIVGINARFTHSCLALFYVRNELERNCPGLSWEMLQFTINDNYYELLLQLSAGSPDYIFFSSAIWNSGLIQRLVGDLRRCLPGCLTVIGGPQADVLRPAAVAAGATVVSGAIESVEAAFYRDLLEGHLKESYGKSFFPLHRRGFSSPYRTGDFKRQLLNRHVYYESSRGCPFQCAYCLSAAERGLFHKDIDLVKEELTGILAHNPGVVRFIDRTFNDIPERALRIWQFLKAQGKDTLFHFEMAPDRFTGPMYDFLATVENGLFQFEIGIQSTNPPTLDAVNRRIDVDTASQTVARLERLGSVHLHVDLILGLPFETELSFAQSFRDVFAMRPHYIQMGLLKLLPGTPLFRAAEEYGYICCGEPPYAVLANRWLDHGTLSELFWFCECVEKFINNRYFVSLWQYLRQKDEDIHTFFQTLLDVCRAGDFFSRPATQELMAEQLVRLSAKRADGECILEILRYDWLRCGFRFLPDCLLPGDDERAEADAVRSRLYQSMPPEMEGLYRKNNRNQFFRKSYFLPVSAKTVELLGLENSYENPCLCVLQEKEKGMFGYKKVCILPC
jgi:radical SAM superfamily enzyme YgiQ (UPF0313 family)